MPYWHKGGCEGQNYNPFKDMHLKTFTFQLAKDLYRNLFFSCHNRLGCIYFSYSFQKKKKIVHQKCVESTKVQFLSLNKKRQLCNFLSQFLKLAIQTIFTRIASFLHTMLTLFLENPSLRITILTFFWIYILKQRLILWMKGSICSTKKICSKNVSYVHNIQIHINTQNHMLNSKKLYFVPAKK